MPRLDVHILSFSASVCLLPSLPLPSLSPLPPSSFSFFFFLYRGLNPGPNTMSVGLYGTLELLWGDCLISMYPTFCVCMFSLKSNSVKFMNQICGYLGYTGHSNKFDFDRRDRGIIHSGGKIEELVGNPFLSVKFRKYREEKFRVFTHRKKHINIVRIISNPGVHGGMCILWLFWQ